MEPERRFLSAFTTNQNANQSSRPLIVRGAEGGERISVSKPIVFVAAILCRDGPACSRTFLIDVSVISETLRGVQDDQERRQSDPHNALL